MKKYARIATAFMLATGLVTALPMFNSCTGLVKKPWNQNSVGPQGEMLVPENFGTAKFTYKEWTGETDGDISQTDIVTVNTAADRSEEVVYFDTEENAIAGARDYNYGLSPYYQLLTGEDKKWDLAVYKNLSDAEEAGVYGNFHKIDYSMKKAPKYSGTNTVGKYGKTAYYGGFKEVTLPASWQTQGFDFPIYSNFDIPFNTYGNIGLSVPMAPTKTNPVGFYRTEFDVSETLMKGRSVYLNFGGVESCFYVWVNGYEVGYSEDSYVATELDITPYLNADGKDNLLCVMVMRWCDGSYFENQDFLRLAGIFRDVYIHSAPGVQIYDYTVVTDLDGNFENASLKVSAELLNRTVETAVGYHVGAQLFDAEGRAVFGDKIITNLKAVDVNSGESAVAEFEKTVEKPHLWSDEDPYLYTLVLTLYDDSGNYYGSIAQQLGFRELTFTPSEGNVKSYDKVLLNGNPILLKGVNRHDTSPDSGKYVSHELYETDIRTMKELNINALRTSHYPDDKYLYYLCDKYGIIVMAEANVEDHGAVGDENTKKYFEDAVTDRIISQTKRMKNRTSILFWSLGNETSRSEIYPELMKQLRAMDPTRMIHFESYGSGSGVDVGSGMYWTVEAVEGRGKEANRMPWVHCEYAHAMGNSVGNLKEYWDVIRSYDNLLGAFIWDYVDQTVATEIPEGSYDYYGNGEYFAYGGDWGDKINSNDFCQNGLLSADRTLQPECYEVKYIYQSVWFEASLAEVSQGRVKVYNEFSVLNLNEFEFVYTLICDGKEIDSGSFSVDCEAKETRLLTIPIDIGEPVDGGEYFLNLSVRLKEDNAWGKKGHEIAHEQFQIAADVAENSRITSTSPITVTESNDTYLIKGVDFELEFDKTAGQISRYTYKGETLLTQGPTVNFRRGVLENDKDFTDSWRYVTQGEASEVTCLKKDSTVTVTSVIPLERAGNSELTMTYTIYGSGEIGVNLHLKQDASKGEMSKLGTVLTLPGDFENIIYYGAGPYDTYNDRNAGASVGLWKTTVSDSFYPYPRPQDTGNKTEVRYFALTSDTKQNGIMVVSSSLMEASALHYTAKELTDAKHVYSLSGSKNVTYLNADYGSRGTGGASCGPGTLDEYSLFNRGSYSYSYTIVPFNKNADTMTLSKSWRKVISEKYLLASPVIEMIESLDGNASDVRKARAAYDALSDGVKAHVTNYDRLLAFEEYISKTYTLVDGTGKLSDQRLNGGLLAKDENSPVGYSYDGSFTVSDRNNLLNGTLSGKSQFTVGVWANFSSMSSGNVLVSRSDTQMSIKIDGNGNLEFFVYDGNWQAVSVDMATAGVSAGSWHYIVGVRDETGLKLYVDGKQVGSKSYTGNVNSSSAKFGVGITDGSDYRLNGAIAAVHLLQGARSSEEVERQYRHYLEGSAKAFDAKDAVLWYDMSEFIVKTY